MDRKGDRWETAQEIRDDTLEAYYLVVSSLMCLDNKQACVNEREIIVSSKPMVHLRVREQKDTTFGGMNVPYDYSREQIPVGVCMFCCVVSHRILYPTKYHEQQKDKHVASIGKGNAATMKTSILLLPTIVGFVSAQVATLRLSQSGSSVLLETSGSLSRIPNCRGTTAGGPLRFSTGPRFVQNLATSGSGPACFFQSASETVTSPIGNCGSASGVKVNATNTSPHLGFVQSTASDGRVVTFINLPEGYAAGDSLAGTAEMLNEDLSQWQVQNCFLEWMDDMGGTQRMELIVDDSTSSPVPPPTSTPTMVPSAAPVVTTTDNPTGAPVVTPTSFPSMAPVATSTPTTSPTDAACQWGPIKCWIINWILSLFGL